MKPAFNMILVFTVYLICVFIFVGVRDANFQQQINLPVSSIQSNIAHSPDANNLCALPACLRVSAKALFDQIQRLFQGLFHGFTGYDPADFGGQGTMSFDIRLMTILAGVIFRIIVLLPILFAAVLLFATVWSQLEFIVLTFLSLSGWGPWLYVNWYRFIGQFIDWPKAWWDFLHPLAIFDFGAIGFVFLLILYLSLRNKIRFWEAVALTAGGQSIFEHLGLVTGVSIFVFVLLHEKTSFLGQRFKNAMTYLAVCGVTSILVFIGVYTSKISVAGLVISSPENRGIGLAVTGYFLKFWVASGSLNFAALDILAANFISLLWPPLFAGLMLAGFMKITNQTPAISLGQIRRRADAGLAVVVGFVAALFVGLFVSGYHSEAGRQLLPLISSLIFAAAYQSYWYLMKSNRLAD